MSRDPSGVAPHPSRGWDGAPRVRDGYLDLLRVIGTVAVVAGHTEGLVPPTLIYTWHVPLFFLLSGYLWRDGRRFTDEIRRRVRTLAVPYAVWFLIVAAASSAVLLAKGQFELKGLVKAAAGGAHAVWPYSAFWFISALLVGVLAVRLLDEIGVPLWGQLVLSLVAVAMAWHFAGLVERSPFAIGQGLACTVFVLGGRYLRRWARSAIQGTRAAVGVLALAAGVVLVLTGLAVPLDLKHADFGAMPWSVLAAFLLCAGAVVLPLRLQGAGGRVVTTLATASVPVILGHSLVLWLGDGLLGSGLLLGLALIVPWALGLALARFSFGWVFGCDGALTRSRVVEPKP